MASNSLLLAATAFAALSSTLPAQAARESATAKVGATNLRIDYGAPPWSESRKAQIEQGLPVGSVWRLGADTRTTFVVEGGDVAIGGQLIESGGYGLNLRRIGAKEWAFVVYDGSDTTVLPDDNEWQIAATLAEKSDAAPPQLAIAFAEMGGRQSLVVRWGPMELSAPVAALTSRDADLAVAGEQGVARWFSCDAKAAPAAGAWMRVGRVANFWVGDSDASFDVDLKLGDGQATLRFENKERAKVATKVARLEAALAAAKARADAAPSPRMQQAIEKADAALKEKQAELAALTLLPAPHEVVVKLAAAKKASGRVGAELVRRNDKLIVVVDADGKAGEAAVDEKKIVPSAAGS